MTIIDKRKSGKHKSVDNRQRFIKRYKQHIKKSIDEHKGSITDSPSNRKAKISKKDLQEPDFSLDHETGRGERVLPGNKQFEKDDTIFKPRKDKARGTGGSGKGNGEEDDFSFVLTKDEFMDIYFSEMALPNFVKQSLKDNHKFKLVRSGYSKDGIPPRLDLLKTFKQSIARRIATGKTTDSDQDGENGGRFLDDIDLRYKYFVKKPFPILQAHVFFLMDVSGSMGEYEKTMAKKFFTLLYLFLSKEYKKVTVTFVRHTEDAKEVDEHEFFYSRESGGTVVSNGLKLINEIIDTRLNLHETNIYIAQASDGDNFYNDEEYCVTELVKLINKVQYFAYIQTEEQHRQEYKEENNVEDLYSLYTQVAAEHHKLNIRKVASPDEIYPVLKDLFAKEQ